MKNCELNPVCGDHPFSWLRLPDQVSLTETGTLLESITVKFYISKVQYNIRKPVGIATPPDTFPDD